MTPPERADESVAVESSMAAGMYEAAVDAAKEHILAGDIFQVVLAQRFDVRAPRPTRSTSTARCAR